MTICGIDEAGRGPLAGPVVAAAVVLPEDFPRSLLADSKTIPEKRREILAGLIKEKAVCWSLALASQDEIDEINILRASLLAMKRAFYALPRRPDRVLVDGTKCPDIDVSCEAVVRGDSLIPEIMAASILAKTHRDRLMRDYAREYPQYGFERHKGYPTREHQKALKEFGPSGIHRKTFRLDFSS